TMARTEDGRAAANHNFKLLADQMLTLTDQLRSEQQFMARLADTQAEMRQVLTKLGDLASGGNFGLDANSRTHLRNIDARLGALAEDMSRGRDASVQDLRAEIKVLARTIAVAAGLERS